MVPMPYILVNIVLGRLSLILFCLTSAALLSQYPRANRYLPPQLRKERTLAFVAQALVLAVLSIVVVRGWARLRNGFIFVTRIRRVLLHWPYQFRGADLPVSGGALFFEHAQGSAAAIDWHGVCRNDLAFRYCGPYRGGRSVHNTMKPTLLRECVLAVTRTAAVTVERVGGMFGRDVIKKAADPEVRPSFGRT